MNGDGCHPGYHTLNNTNPLFHSIELSTKYSLRMSNLCAQHDIVAELKHRHTATCMCVNAIRIILRLTLVTHGHLLRVKLGATKGTYIPSSPTTFIIVLLCRCSPYMCRPNPIPNTWIHGESGSEK